MRLGDEDSVIGQQKQDGIDYVVNILYMSEHVGGGYYFRLAHLIPLFGGTLFVKERDFGGNVLLDGQLAHLSRLNALHAVPAVSEIGEQRAVIRADVDCQVRLVELDYRLALSI